MYIEKIEDIYFARIGSYTTSAQTKKEFLKNIIECIKLNIELKGRKQWKKSIF